MLLSVVHPPPIRPGPRKRAEVGLAVFMTSAGDQFAMKQLNTLLAPTIMTCRCAAVAGGVVVYALCSSWKLVCEYDR